MAFGSKDIHFFTFPKIILHRPKVSLSVSEANLTKPQAQSVIISFPALFYFSTFQLSVRKGGTGWP